MKATAGAAILLTVMLTGCAAANYPETNAQYTDTGAGSRLAAQIIPGKTTKQDIIRLLGQPHHTTVNADAETWMYENRNMPMLAGMIVGGTGAYKATATTIMFNRDGTVKTFFHV